VGDYHRWVGTGAVMFVLDGQWLQQRYPVKPVDYWERSWLSSGGSRSRESEDRVFSRDPTIATGGVKMIHVLLKEQHENRSPEVRKLLILAKRLGIPAYLYNDEQAWRLQDTRKAITIAQAASLLKGQDPSRRSYGRKYLSRWLELIHKKASDELSKEAGRIELEEIQKEKYTPTEEDLEKLEKVLEGNYPIWDKIHEEPISPTEDELKKLEELLDLQVKDDREDHEFFEREYYEIKEMEEIVPEVTEETVVEQPQEVVEYQQPKKLSYLNRSGYGKSLRINRI
jgi:transcriptional regulator with XRE-family HTH domain